MEQTKNNKQKTKGILQNGFVDLGILAIGALVVIAILIPLTSNWIVNKTVTTQEKAVDGYTPTNTPVPSCKSRGSFCSANTECCSGLTCQGSGMAYSCQPPTAKPTVEPCPYNDCYTSCSAVGRVIDPSQKCSNVTKQCCGASIITDCESQGGSCVGDEGTCPNGSLSFLCPGITDKCCRAAPIATPTVEPCPYTDCYTSCSAVGRVVDPTQKCSNTSKQCCGASIITNCESNGGSCVSDETSCTNGALSGYICSDLNDHCCRNTVVATATPTRRPTVAPTQPAGATVVPTQPAVPTQPIQPPSDPEPPGTGSAPACNPAQLVMGAAPNPVSVGSSIVFSMSGNQGSTHVQNSFTLAGVTPTPWQVVGISTGSFSTTWPSSSTRTALTAGNYIWTHYWKNCAPNDCTVTSAQCKKTLAYTITGSGQLTAVPTVDVITPTITVKPEDQCPGGALGNINCDKYVSCTLNGEARGTVNSTDLQMLLDRWSKVDGRLPNDPNCWKSADIHQVGVSAGKVDVYDLQKLLNNWSLN